ncbi:dsDNA nuclease domain-containing protein [Thiobacillus sedimenti]|uniref:dsDNA nuclease domain-containing protein n=1 Tax=Thiobacillus sedimenti TaxID=3110231 RepID=UPI00389B1463
MFELEESGADDFLILFEAVQDVAELDSATDPSSIRIYQVKKKDRGEWEWSNLTRLAAPAKKMRTAKTADEIKDSPIGKLYSAVLALKSLKSSGVFLSNAGCNLPLANGDNAATSVSCDLSQLEAGHLSLLKAGLESLHEAGASLVNLELIRVEKVPIHPDSPVTHLVGVAVAFLNKHSQRHAGQAKSLVDALLAEVGPLGAKTDSCSNFDELRRQRGYSRGQFAEQDFMRWPVVPS